MHWYTIALNKAVHQKFFPLELSSMNNPIAMSSFPHLIYLITPQYWLHQGLMWNWLYRSGANFCLGQHMSKATQRRLNASLPNVRNNSFTSLTFLSLFLKYNFWENQGNGFLKIKIILYKHLKILNACAHFPIACHLPPTD